MLASGYRNVLPVPIILVFFVFILMVIAGSALYYKSHKEKYLSLRQSELKTIGSIKADEIIKWRKERVSDADVIYNNRPLIKQIAGFYNAPGNNQIKEEIIIWIQSLIKNFDYQSILLLDSSGEVTFSYPPSDTVIDSPTRAKIDDVYTYNEITFTDLHSSRNFPSMHIDMLVPISSDNTNTIGTVVLRIDPDVQLFPILKMWPTPSESSETFLVRRDGDSIVYLNRLKYQGDTAINVKLPLENSSLPAAQAIMGVEGSIEGIDYRNEPVIAFLKKIPDTPWYIISKVDKKEIYAHL